MRLMTRGDVDGIMCAALLKAAGIIGEMVQVHPKDMQDGVVEVGADDIICNLPFAEGCGMWFDHHSSEELSERLPEIFQGRYDLAPSAARLVFEHFVGEHPEIKRLEPLLEVVDRFDSAQLSREDIVNPEPALLLAYVLDPRTGLGYHHTYRVSNKEMTQMMPDLLVEYSVAEILAMPDIKERTERYRRLEEGAAQVYAMRSRVEGNVVVSDLRDVRELPPANRFLVYTMPGHENTNISIRLSTVRGGGKVSIQVGHNILNRTSTVDVGELMASLGGGGHRGAGTCQVPAEDADRVFEEILEKVKDK